MLTSLCTVDVKPGKPFNERYNRGNSNSKYVTARPLPLPDEEDEGEEKDSAMPPKKIGMIQVVNGERASVMWVEKDDQKRLVFSVDKKIVGDGYACIVRYCDMQSDDAQHVYSVFEKMLIGSRTP
jgi:hypothetical protein